MNVKRNLFGENKGTNSPQNTMKKNDVKVDAAKGRQSLARTAKSQPNQRIDITRLNTKQYEDLLDGVNIDTQEEDIRSREQKKIDAKHKREVETLVVRKVMNMGNIYSDNDSDGEKVESNGPTQKDQGGGPINQDLGKDKSKASEELQLTENAITPTTATPTNAVESRDSDGVGTKATDNVISVISAKGDETNNSGVHDSLLDATLPMSCHAETQTDAYKCEECSSLYQELNSVLLRHIAVHGKKGEKGGTLTNTLKKADNSRNLETSRSASVSPQKEKMSALIKGCTVFIPLSKKAALSTEIPDGDPQKMTDYLLDCIFSLEEQAQMTCDGKVENTKPLPKEVSSCMQVFIQAKYDPKRFNFDGKLFKTFVNGKFYKARNWVRKHHPELVEQGIVRPKMKKNTKKKVDEQNKCDGNETGGSEGADDNSDSKNKNRNNGGNQTKKSSTKHNSSKYKQPTDANKNSKQRDKQKKEVRKLKAGLDEEPPRKRERSDGRSVWDGSRDRTTVKNVADKSRGGSNRSVKHVAEDDSEDERKSVKHNRKDDSQDGRKSVKHNSKGDSQDKRSEKHNSRGDKKSEGRKRHSNSIGDHPDKGIKCPKPSILYEADMKMKDVGKPSTSTPKDIRKTGLHVYTDETYYDFNKLNKSSDGGRESKNSQRKREASCSPISSSSGKWSSRESYASSNSIESGSGNSDSED